jgi:hypothetical protein
MFNTAEEFGQSLQKIIDRHRQDLSILLEEYGITESDLNPAFLVQLYKKNAPLVILSLAQTEGIEDDLSHLEGESTVDKLEGLFQDGVALVSKVQTLAGKISGGSTTKDPGPEPEQKSGITTKKIIIGGVIVVIVLTLILVAIKKKK